MFGGNQYETPFFSAILQYAQKGIVPFHTPGHKQGEGVHHNFESFVGRNIFRIDLSELEAFEHGHNPEEVLHETQKLAAEAFGADYTFFLVNGTTSGIEAMIMAVIRPGEKLIVPRNVHKSIIGGMILSGAQPVYLKPEVNTELGIAMGIEAPAYAAALEEHPDAKAVLVINPNYYGLCGDIQKIVETVHAGGQVVLVDEAHGPHLRFHPDLPLSALEAGADLVAQSTHKILGSLTQSSMLHVKSERVRVARVKTMLRLIQSTSPSYLLLASLDVARMQMATQGERLLTRTIELAEQARRRINQIHGLYCFGTEIIGRHGVHNIDPTKLTISVKGIGFTGMMAETILRNRHGIQVELSDLYNILLIVSIGDTQEDIDKVVAALEDLATHQASTSDHMKRLAEVTYNLRPPGLPKQFMLPRDAIFASIRAIPFKEAAGQVSAELLAPYPPGIPVICPGEEITQEIIDYLELVKEVGIYIQGPEDYRLEKIKVVDSSL
ncbi:MAG: aminotransferase class I/II-fold pyridoxal phosphate-dependent enzyme [Syntrophothermus sp.]